MHRAVFISWSYLHNLEERKSKYLSPERPNRNEHYKMTCMLLIKILRLQYNETELKNTSLFRSQKKETSICHVNLLSNTWVLEMQLYMMCPTQCMVRKKMTKPSYDFFVSLVGLIIHAWFAPVRNFLRLCWMLNSFQSNWYIHVLHITMLRTAIWWNIYSPYYSCQNICVAFAALSANDCPNAVMLYDCPKCVMLYITLKETESDFLHTFEVLQLDFYINVRKLNV